MEEAVWDDCKEMHNSRLVNIGLVVIGYTTLDWDWGPTIFSSASFQDLLYHTLHRHLIPSKLSMIPLHDVFSDSI